MRNMKAGMVLQVPMGMEQTMDIPEFKAIICQANHNQ